MGGARIWLNTKRRWVVEMEMVRTGLVHANGYARKIKRVMFGVFNGKVDNREIAKTAGEINSKLYEVVVGMGLDKHDAIKIEFPVEVKDGELKPLLEQGKIEVYKKTEEISLGEVL